MKKIFSKEVKIALVAIVGIILLFFGLNKLKGLTVFSDDIEYKMTFDNIDGMSTSCPIYADGFRVGTVTGIDYDYENSGHIVATVGIDKNLRIPKGSTAEISSDLMGNTQVNILMATNPRERLEPGGIISGAMNDGAMGEVKALIPTVQAMLPKLDSILASVNALLADPAIAGTLHNAEAATANLKTSTTELNSLLANINKQVPGILTKADGTMANAQTITDNLATIDISATMAKVDQTLSNVEQLTNTLNSKEGSIGLLLHDKGLYNNLNATMGHADSLMIDFKAHPSRYIHFSVFGKKDK